MLVFSLCILSVAVLHFDDVFALAFFVLFALHLQFVTLCHDFEIHSRSLIRAAGPHTSNFNSIIGFSYSVLTEVIKL